MSISTNKFLNHIVIALGKISGGKIQKEAIRILYWYYRNCPPHSVRESRKYNELHKEDIKTVESLLCDAESKRIYISMLDFRATYDLRIHPGYTKDANFVKELVRCGEDEVFVDCGAYDGDTIKLFLNYVNGKYKRIVAFEPDPTNFAKASDYLSTMGGELKDRIVLIKKGVSDSKKVISFKANGDECSMITDEENDKVIKIETIALDELVECSDATYIKMDIEGEEMNALKGAQKLIMEKRPKLAISIYHKDSDMTDIALFIHELVPEYRMFVRQHSHSYYDTVLYCFV
ncbi:MAG: FkbM family methyltransferase [Lachnospiraceae bacterium]|nr:FkbM family methyltransferase [Lachnospiraceae bacterium]